MAERCQVEFVKTSEVCEGDVIWPSSYTGFQRVVTAKHYPQGAHIQLNDGHWTFPPAGADVLRRVLLACVGCGAELTEEIANRTADGAPTCDMCSFSADSIDATEEVAEGDEREWTIHQADDAIGRKGSLFTTGPKLSEPGSAILVVPKSRLTAERERREQAVRLLHRWFAAVHPAHPDPTLNRETGEFLAPLSDRGEGQ